MRTIWFKQKLWRFAAADDVHSKKASKRKLTNELGVDRQKKGESYETKEKGNISLRFIKEEVLC
jgi:hypothetical protein